MHRWSFFLPIRFAYLALFAISVGLLSTHGTAAAGGAWKDRTQVVWSKGTGTLIRKNFRVWDSHPELDLDFLWEPRLASTSDNTETVVSGPGTLTWYVKGAASYDRQFTYSVFKGVLNNGRPNGQGALVVRTGLSYTGQWLDGEMHGRGVLRFENGDKYEGDFVAGKMHGVGKYASTDGSVYLGEFRNGVRDGLGELTLADGEYRTVWQGGQEIDRQQIPDSAPAQSTAVLRLAAISNSIKLKLSVDDKKSIEFENADPDAPSPTYEAEHAPGAMTIRLASKMVLGAWKGDGKIASGEENGVSYILNVLPPVFLKATVENQGTTAAQITGAFLDVYESVTELSPYLELHPGSTKCCGPADDYNPILDFQNFGWGRVRDARMTYSLGPEKNRTDETVVQLGSFEASKRTSIVDRLRQLGVDVEKLRKSSVAFWIDSRGDGVNPNAFSCGDGAVEGRDTEEKTAEEQDAQEKNAEKERAKCFESIKNSGVLGRLKDLAFRQKDDNVLYTILTGRIEYKWTDSNGKSNDRSSTFATHIPLLRFAPPMAEMGYEEPIERQVKSTALSLDRRKYQVPFPKTWNAKLPGSEGMQFDFALSAAKSSHHIFQIVLQLADGNQVRSSMVDLSYFRPRLTKKER
jgi:hypothetical protein